MDKINNIGLSRLLTSVYDFDGFTEQEVWCRIAQKINIIIEHFNYIDKKIENEKENNKAKFDYLLCEGLTETVAKIILEKITDGTLGELINDILLKEINNKVDGIANKIVKHVTPIQFKEDNDIDDTNSLQKAIDYCLLNGTTLKADKDIYLISNTLRIQELISIEFDNATIKATTNIDSIFTINVTIRPDGTHVLGTAQGLISNIRLDCNNLVNKAIYIADGRKYIFEKIKIYNLSGTGVKVSAGYEMFFKNFDIVGTDINAVGIDITTSDCHFEDIILTDVKRGIINSGTNFYTRVHGWMFTPNFLASSSIPSDNSIFFTLVGGGTPQLNQCYSDTYYISVYVTNYTRIFLNGFTVFFSEYVYTGDLLQYKPYIFYYEVTTETDYTISDFSRQTILTDSMIRGINSTNYALLSNLPKGTSFIRIDNDSNELVYVNGIEENCVSGLNVKTQFSFTADKCYNVVSRKDNRVNCKLKLYSETALTPNTDYTIALFTDRYIPNMEFITQASVSTDGYSSNYAPVYCYISPSNGIIIKTPNDDVLTRKYVTVDITFDMDYYV